MDFDAELPDSPRIHYGRDGVIYEPVPGAGGEYADRISVAVWRNQLMMMGMEDKLKNAIDQIEGRAPRTMIPIRSGDTYGDAYGAVPGWFIAAQIRKTEPALANRIRDMVDAAQIHLDARGALTLTAKFYGHDGGQLDDLERAMAGALAAARLAAQAAGHPKVADLLDDAKVVPTDSGFTLDVAVPQSWLDDTLGKCQIFDPAPQAPTPTPSP